MDRRTVLAQAVDQCMKELYSLAQPSITWDKFLEENIEYTEKYKKWNPSIPLMECVGPRPYEFYYLPGDIMKDICDSYINAYKFDSKQELLDTIETLKNYCKEPIVDKYIEGELREDGTRWPGHRGYEHPDNLEKQLANIIPDSGFDTSEIVKEVQNKFFEFLDMAGNFFNWNGDLNCFNVNVYLGGSPNLNKEAVIKNWKKYRNKDIEIDDSLYNKFYNDDDE